MSLADDSAGIIRSVLMKQEYVCHVLMTMQELMRCSGETGICLSLLLTVQEYVCHVMMTVQEYLLFSDEAEICFP